LANFWLKIKVVWVKVNRRSDLNYFCLSKGKEAFPKRWTPAMESRSSGVYFSGYL